MSNKPNCLPEGFCPSGFMVSGAVFCVLGLIAVIFPFFGTIAADLLIGGVLLLAGVMLALKALMHRKWDGVVLDIAGACINITIGGILIGFPGVGASLLALFFASCMAADGFFKAAFAFGIKPAKDWWVFLFAGAFEMLLCFFLIWIWPADAAWVPGLFAGFYLWSTGVSLLAFARGLKVSAN